MYYHRAFCVMVVTKKTKGIKADKNIKAFKMVKSHG